MKSILISIKPKYCELIAKGRKTIELRKTKPNLKPSFKCYIYMTKSNLVGDRKAYKDRLAGKVIGEFICDCIIPISITYSDPNNSIAQKEFPYTCLTDKEIMDYLGNGNLGYGWHISDLIIYDKPKELSEFVVIDKDMLKECTYRIRAYNNPDYTNGALLKGTYVCNNSFEPEFCRGQCGIATKPLTRPPQSWYYVEV